MTGREGVIKYQLQFTAGEPLHDHDYQHLDFWHRIFKEASILGQEAGRYDGLGFGNLSQRLSQQCFLISGTQTGHLGQLLPKHYAQVTGADIEQNRILATGNVKPSSESLTHAAIYALNDDIQFVFHAHSPDIWRARKTLGIPETRESIPYGTPDMAVEMKRLSDEFQLEDQGVIAMAGHEDGVISYAATADVAGKAMIDLLREAQNLPG